VEVLEEFTEPLFEVGAFPFEGQRLIHLIYLSVVQDRQSICATIEARTEDDKLTGLIPDPFREKVVNQACARYRRSPSARNAAIGYFFHERPATWEARKQRHSLQGRAKKVCGQRI
jgi:hypothetical protein